MTYRAARGGAGALLLIALLVSACGTPEVDVPGRYAGGPAAAPSPSANSIGRLSLNTQGYNATGFFLSWNGQEYIVTAYHAARGELAKDKPILTLFRNGHGICSASQPLSRKGRTATAADASQDLAITKIFFKASAAKALKLASAPPRVGQPVWVFHIPFTGGIPGAEFLSPRAPVPTLAKGVVTRSSNKRIEFQFEGGGPETTWTSGSPVLNAAGDVVGINVYAFGHCRGNSGGAAIQVSGNCDVRGVAVPHESISNLLRSS